MYIFQNNVGSPDRISKGCSFIWDLSCPGVFSVTKAMDGQSGFYWGGDDKRFAKFLRSTRDFEDFVEIVAEMHNLKTKVTRTDTQVMIIELV